MVKRATLPLPAPIRPRDLDADAVGIADGHAASPDTEVVFQTGLADRARYPLRLEILHARAEVIDVAARLAMGNTQK